MGNRHLLAARTSVLAGALLGVSAAHAQTTADPDGIEEIVVTARRVSETVQEIPAAISAISGDRLSDLLVDDAAALIRQVPGATLVTSGPSYIADISMRGQGGGRIGSSESATGVYRDGHYAAGGAFGGRTLNRLDLFDLQRIEVLRGPQGALYGRNAVGGSLNAIAAKPVFDSWNGWAQVGADSLETVDVRSGINVPLVDDRLAARVAGFVSDQKSGHITNVKTGNKVDQRESAGGRAALAWRISENVVTRLTYEYFDDKTPGFGSLGYRASLYNGTQADPGVFERVLNTEAYANIDQDTVYWDTTIATRHGDWHFNFDHKRREGSRFDEDYSHFLGYEDAVLGGAPVQMLNSQTEDFDNVGGQIYLTSPGSLDRWRWGIGVDGLEYESQGSTTVYGTAAPAGLRRLFRDDASTENVRSIAAFATLGYAFTPELTLDLELRAQRDEKSLEFSRTPSTANSLTAPFSLDLSKTDTEILPTVSLRYAFTGSQLAYVRLATGYRPGGFNTSIPADTPDADQLIPYDREYVYGGELGWKSEFFEGAWTVNIAAYYTETQDVLAVTAASLTTPTFILQNAGDNHVYGIELETVGRIDLGFGRLDLSAAVSSNDGAFDDGTTVVEGGSTVDISGNRVNRTRDFKGSLGAVLNVPFRAGIVASLGANMQIEKGGFFDVSNEEKLSDFTLVDLTASLLVDRWKFSAYVSNVNDNVYLLQELNRNNFYNAPRVYGGSVRYSF